VRVRVRDTVRVGIGLVRVGVGLVRVRVDERASASRAAACASPRMARNMESRMKTATKR